MLIQWCERSGFEQVCCVDVTPTSTDEQRSTLWKPGPSLQDYLNPQGTQTLEGYPPPLRATVIARNPVKLKRRLRYRFD